MATFTDESVGCSQPLSDQPQWSVRRHLFAKIYLNVVIAGQPLVLAPAESVEITVVALGHDRGHVRALVVGSPRDRLRLRNDRDRRLLRRYNKPLIGVDGSAGGVIHHHQLQRVVVVGLP